MNDKNNESNKELFNNSLNKIVKDYNDFENTKSINSDMELIKMQYRLWYTVIFLVFFLTILLLFLLLF